MAMPRASIPSRALGRAVLRRAGTQSRQRTWQQIGRRNYATEHAKKSSDLPWLIGSVALTVPSAIWLFNQGPTKSDHHHHEAAHEEHEEEGEDDKSSSESKEQDDSEGGDESKSDDKKTDSKKEDKDDGKDDDSSDAESKQSDSEGSDDSGDDKGKRTSTSGRKFSDDGYELPGPNAPGQINYKKDSGKGPGEGQKGPKPPPETKGEKMSKSDSSGAKHPSIDDADKSKKGAGPIDTAKIHGTVDSKQDAR